MSLLWCFPVCPVATALTVYLYELSQEVVARRVLMREVSTVALGYIRLASGIFASPIFSSLVSNGERDRPLTPPQAPLTPQAPVYQEPTPEIYSKVLEELRTQQANSLADRLADQPCRRLTTSSDSSNTSRRASSAL